MKNASSSRPRPTAELLDRLRKGKETLRTRRRSLSLPDKVSAVITLQRVCLPLVARQRPLRPWERVWDIELSTPASGGTAGHGQD
jgi:hypothetical protein